MTLYSSIFSRFYVSDSKIKVVNYQSLLLLWRFHTGIWPPFPWSCNTIGPFVHFCQKDPLLLLPITVKVDYLLHSWFKLLHRQYLHNYPCQKHRKTPDDGVTSPQLCLTCSCWPPSYTPGTLLKKFSLPLFTSPSTLFIPFLSQCHRGAMVTKRLQRLKTFIIHLLKGFIW